MEKKSELPQSDITERARRVASNILDHQTSFKHLFSTSTDLWNATYDVHDSQDVVFHGLAPMVLHHFGVGHHQRFHPLLLADGALADSPPLPQPPPLPALPPSLRVGEALTGIWGEGQK